MQIDLATVVASDFPRLSKPQQSEIELIRAIAQGDKRAMPFYLLSTDSASTALRCAWSTKRKLPKTW